MTSGLLRRLVNRVSLNDMKVTVKRELSGVKELNFLKSTNSQGNKEKGNNEQLLCRLHKLF